MKIAKIEAIPVSYPEPNDFNALRHLCLAKITADDGQIGWGESITQFPEANFAVKAIIDGMAPNLIGKDPVHTEALWRQNKHQAWWYGYGGGIASYAVSAACSISSAGRCMSACPASPPATRITNPSRRWPRRRWNGSRRACKG